jgi:hypothetical protein
MTYRFETTIISDMPFLTIHWDRAAEVVTLEWREFVKGAAYRDSLDKALETAIENEGHRWLADTRNMQVVDQADQRWINEDWYPRAVAGGITRMALVMPESTLAKMAMDNMANMTEHTGMETNYFDSVYDARAWLLQG